jgi:DNA-binding NarL/FixJ family response regulator
MTTNPIRICVADEHLMMRLAATLVLALNDMVLVGEAQTGAEALGLCAECQPDVLLDLFLPDVDTWYQ